MIFVVGNSRSGTTMLGRMLGAHSDIFTFEELHFFEQLWTPGQESAGLDRGRATRLTARLLGFQRQGILEAGDSTPFMAEAAGIVSSDNTRPSQLFASFLSYEARLHGKSVGCDQTPANLYFLSDILTLYPEAKAIVMARDPRDVLASQKQKWGMRFRGFNQDPIGEAVRLKINYHPITTSLLWNAAIRTAAAFSDHPRVRQVRFEDLLAEPERHTRDICAFLEVPYQSAMLAIPQVNSSYEPPDPSRRGLSSEAAGRWQRGALTATELFLCERVSRRGMVALGYQLSHPRPNPFSLTLSVLLFPLKAALAFVVNLPKRRSVLDSIRRRLGRRR